MTQCVLLGREKKRKEIPPLEHNLVFPALCWTLCIHTPYLHAATLPPSSFSSPSSNPDSHAHTLIRRHGEAWTCD